MSLHPQPSVQRHHLASGLSFRMTSPVARLLGTMPLPLARAVTTRIRHTACSSNRPERVPPREVHRGALAACTRQLLPTSESRSTPKLSPFRMGPLMGLPAG